MTTINLDLTNPINTVRVMVGDVDSCNPMMTDMMYQQIIDLNTINSRNECVIVWFSAIQAAGYLMAHFAPEAMRYRERVNAVEVEQYGGERYRGYANLLKWLRNNPPLNCPLSGTLFHFGGTYTECSTFYTMQYINNCLCDCWGKIWIDGYYQDCS
jgi:hypothetical protein